MKSICSMIFLLGTVSFSFTAGENPNRFRRSYDQEILKNRKNNFGVKVGIPLVFEGEKKYVTRTGIPETRTTKETGKETTDESAKATSDGKSDQTQSGISKNNNDSGEDEEERVGSVANNKKNAKNEEEMGSGYDNIDDIESGQEDDEDSESDNIGSGNEMAGSGSVDDDKIVGEKEHVSKSSEGSKDVPNLNGEFPPSADQASKLPKDVDVTPEEFDRKMADKRKGYMQFTVRQRFKPEYKYKESPGYKIMAGNVIHDVEEALQTTGVVKDVLFREANDVGGPPYTSKVQVYLKLKNVKPKRLKKIINYGLINGMIVVPGSFHAT